MTPVTPHEIAELAFIRRNDPALALSIAEQSGKAHDQCLSVEEKETKNVKRASR